MERSPNNFFRDFDKAKEGRKLSSLASYQRKVINKHFPHLIEGLPGYASDPDPLNFLKNNISTDEVDRLFIVKMDEELIKLFKLPSLVIWSEFQRLMDEGRDSTVLVFPVSGAGDWVLHNLSEVPEGAINQARMMVPTENWRNVYCQPIKTYIQER